MSISAIQFQNMINFCSHIYIFINCSCEFYHLPHFHHLDLQRWWLFKARGTKALSGAWIFLGPPRGSGLLVLACIVQTPLIVMTNLRILWSVQKIWLVLEDCRQWSNNWFQKAMKKSRKNVWRKNCRFRICHSLTLLWITSFSPQRWLRPSYYATVNVWKCGRVYQASVV